jgi:hypothetical protein
MVEIDYLLTEYLKLREKGIDPKTALTSFRAEILALDIIQREKLIEKVRSLELNRAASAKRASHPPESQNDESIKLAQTVPLPMTSNLDPAKLDPPKAQTPPPTLSKVNCPNCGKPNDAGEVLCYSCGQLLVTEGGMFETHLLADQVYDIPSDKDFGPEATLVLVVKGIPRHYRLRPQDKGRDIIIGRGSGGTVKPDVDLAPYEATELGVSRLHLSIRYNERYRTLSAGDMGSSNGTMINGQRLHPEEKRILRHGDEVRLGKLTLVVYFYRPKPFTT